MPYGEVQAEILMWLWGYEEFGARKRANKTILICLICRRDFLYVIGGMLNNSIVNSI